jgi:hypothetical protein
MDVNRQEVIEDRRSGMSLTQLAKKYDISRASVCKLMNEHDARPWEILRSSKISIENLAAYVEVYRYLSAAEGERVQHLLAKHGWPDRAFQAISGGMAIRPEIPPRVHKWLLE